MAHVSTSPQTQEQQSRESINSCLMYLYQSLVNQGFTDKAAKEKVAEELASMMDEWRTSTGLNFNASTVINPHRLLDGLVESTSKEAAASLVPAAKAKWQGINRQLIDLRAMTKKEGT